MIEDGPGKPELAALFLESAAIMARLRGPDGCPWDREQTPESIRKYTLEETYEVLDTIERRDWPHLAEELGDLLLQVLFYAQMAEEAGHFNLADVLTGLNRKLVRRHPHVFGDKAAAAAGNRAEGLTTEGINSDGVLRNWKAIKELEKQTKARQDGYLAEVLRAQSALGEAAKLGSAAARSGFDWPDAGGLLEKVREETTEIAAELALGLSQPGRQARISEEVGDLLFTVVNLSRHLKLDAEMTLRDANAKFRRRFEAMQQASLRPLDEMTPAELEQAWAAVKVQEGLSAVTTHGGRSSGEER